MVWSGWRLVTGAALLAWFAGCSSGGSNGTDGTNAPTATVSGMASLAGGAPAAGASVSIRGGGPSATADSYGSFSLADVPLGFHELSITSGAYEEIVPVSVSEAGGSLVDGSLWPMLPIELPRAHRLTSAPATLAAQSGDTCDPILAPGLGSVLFCEYDYGDGTQSYAWSALPTGSIQTVTSRTYTGRGAGAWSSDGTFLFIVDGWDVANQRSARLLELTAATGAVRTIDVQGYAYELVGILPDGRRPVWRTGGGDLNTTTASGTAALLLGQAMRNSNNEWTGYRSIVRFAGNGRQLYAAWADMGTAPNIAVRSLSSNDATKVVANGFVDWRPASATKVFLFSDWDLTTTSGKIRVYDANADDATTVVLDGATGFVEETNDAVLARAIPAGDTVPRSLALLSRANATGTVLTDLALRQRFTADGTKVLVWEGTSGAATANLALYDVIGTARTLVATDVPADFPVIERSGVLLGVEGWTASGGMVFTFDIGSGAKYDLGAVGTTVQLAGFSPGSTHVAWLDPWDGSSATGTLKLAPAAGGAVVTAPGQARGTPQSDGTVPLASAVWSAAGDQVAFEALYLGATGLVQAICTSDPVNYGCLENAAELHETTPGNVVLISNWDPLAVSGTLEFCHFGTAGCETALSGGSAIAAFLPVVLPGGAHVVFFNEYNPISGTGALLLANVPAPGGGVTVTWHGQAAPGFVHASADGTKVVFGGPGLAPCFLDVSARWSQDCIVWEPGSFFVTSDFARVFVTGESGGLWTSSPDPRLHDLSLLATGVPGYFSFGGASFTADGTRFVVPTEVSAGSSMVTAVNASTAAVTRIGRATSWRLARDPASTGEILLMKRTGTAPPFSFQDGTYAAQVP